MHRRDQSIDTLIIVGLIPLLLDQRRNAGDDISIAGHGIKYLVDDLILIERDKPTASEHSLERCFDQVSRIIINALGGICAGRRRQPEIDVSAGCVAANDVHEIHVGHVHRR